MSKPFIISIGVKTSKINPQELMEILGDAKTNEKHFQNSICT